MRSCGAWLQQIVLENDDMEKLEKIWVSIHDRE
jgi:hypothetical protein